INARFVTDVLPIQSLPSLLLVERVAPQTGAVDDLADLDQRPGRISDTGLWLWPTTRIPRRPLRIHWRRWAAAACSIQSSLLTVAALTLIFYTLLSLRSLRSSAAFPSSEMDVAEVSGDISSPETVFFLDLPFAGDLLYLPDGDPNTYFQTLRKPTGKYSTEGYFFQNTSRIREYHMRI
ncbi:Exostosin family, partial [Musa troglodytarum]